MVEPESLDMNVILPMGIRVCTSFCAVMIGPTALVVRCLEKSPKELVRFSKHCGRWTIEILHFSRSLYKSIKDLHVPHAGLLTLG